MCQPDKHVTTGQPVNLNAICTQAAFQTSPTTNTITDVLTLVWWDNTTDTQIPVTVTQTGDMVNTDGITAQGTWTCAPQGVHSIYVDCENNDAIQGGGDNTVFTVTCL